MSRALKRDSISLYRRCLPAIYGRYVIPIRARVVKAEVARRLARSVYIGMRAVPRTHTCGPHCVCVCVSVYRGREELRARHARGPFSFSVIQGFYFLYYLRPHVHTHNWTLRTAFARAAVVSLSSAIVPDSGVRRRTPAHAGQT